MRISVRAALAAGLALLAAALGSAHPKLGAALAVGGLLGSWELWRRGAQLRLDARVALGLGALGVVALPALAMFQDPYQGVSPAQLWRALASGEAALSCLALGWLSTDRWGGSPPAWPATRSPDRCPRWLRVALGVALGAAALALPLSIAATQLTLLACAALLWVCLALGARLPPPTPLDAPVLALLAIALASVASSPAPELWDTTALRTLLAFCVVSRAVAVSSGSRPEAASALALRLAILWSAAAAAGASLAFSQHWSGFDLTAALGFRPVLHVPVPGASDGLHFAGTGTLNSRLTFAHVTLLPAALLAGLWGAGALGPRLRPLAAMALLLEGLGLWASFARGAWLALALTLLALAALAGAFRSLRRGLPAALALAALVALGLALSPGARSRAASSLSLEGNRDRRFLWARGVEILVDHPVLGVGFGSYRHALGPYYDRREPAFAMRTWAHDMALSLWAETGPLGLFAYLWLFSAVGFAVAAALRSADVLSRGLTLGAGLGALAFFVVSLFHDALYDGEVAYNLFFALGLSAGLAALLAPSDAEPRLAAPTLPARPPRRRRRLALVTNLTELWQFRALIGALVTRELEARYRGSVLGFLWTFVNPLLLMAVYLLVFGIFLKQEMVHYTFYMFVGLLPWGWFSSSLGAGTASLASKRDLLTRVRFPPQVLPAVVVLCELANYLLAVPLMVLLALLTGAPLHWTALLFPLAIAVQLTFTLGLVYLTSALNVFFRDLQHVVVNLLTLWFFLVPVLYARERIPPGWRFWAIGCDPMAVAISSYQDLWFYGRLPNFAYLGLASAVALALLVLGCEVFEARRDEFAEVV